MFLPKKYARCYYSKEKINNTLLNNPLLSLNLQYLYYCKRTYIILIEEKLH